MPLPKASLTTLLALGLAAPAAATAQTVARPPDRVFMLLGTESSRLAPAGGSTVATDVSRAVSDLAELPDGRVVVLTEGGKLDVIDVRGRIARLPARIELAGERARDLDVAADGTLLVAAGQRLWRVDLSGATTALTPAIPETDVIQTVATFGVLAVDALPDGDYVYTESQRVWRVAADGARTLIAGNGQEGDPRRGRATDSPLQWPVRVAALDDGRVIFVDQNPYSGGASAYMVAGGELQPYPLSRFGGATDLVAMPGGRLAVLADGLRVWGEPPVVGTDFVPPLWAGLRARRVGLGDAAAIAPTASGEWLVAMSRGVALVTGSAAVPRRLAVAVHLETRATLPRRIRIAATRAAAVEVRAGRRVLTRGRVVAGVTTLGLSRRLPAGEHVLHLRATGDDGAVASHRLTVIAGRDLALASARRAALESAAGFGGDIQPSVEDCRRLGRAAVRCRVSGVGERWARGRLELRRDGWIWVSWNGGPFERTGPR